MSETRYFYRLLTKDGVLGDLTPIDYREAIKYEAGMALNSDQYSMADIFDDSISLPEYSKLCQEAKRRQYRLRNVINQKILILKET